MKKKVCVFTLYDTQGASSQYRAFLFKDRLDSEFDTYWFPFWNNKCTTKYLFKKRKYFFYLSLYYLLNSFKRLYQLYFIAPKCDVVFIQKAVIPWMKLVYLKRLKNKNIRIIFDVDDAIYLNKRDNSRIIAKYADEIICGNIFLKNYYEKYCNKCIVIPTVENTSNYLPYRKDTFNNKIIGWIGSKGTVDNLEIVIEAINRIIKRHPEVSLHIISNDDGGFTKVIKNSKLIIWNSKTYIEELSKLSIGIMPLKTSEHNGGKCGFKLIQYLNMLKPVVATDIGVNQKIVGQSGFLANTSEEWEQCIEELLFNKEKYDNCVKRTKELFFKDYSYEVIESKIIEAIDGNIGDK